MNVAGGVFSIARRTLNLEVAQAAVVRDFRIREDVFGICKFERWGRSGSSSEAVQDFYAAFGDTERAPQSEILQVEG